MNAGDAEDYKMTDDEVNHHIIGVVMAQHFSLKAGLKKWGRSHYQRVNPTP